MRNQSPLVSPERMAERVMVTVNGLSGNVLLESIEVSSIKELEEKSASKLKARECCIVSADGRMITHMDDLQEHGRVTAVAQNVSPLLQLVGLQNKRGELLDESLPMEKLEEMALETATLLAHIACWFGGPQHLGGLPRIPLHFSLLPTLKEKKYLSMDYSTPVVHAGARVLLYIKNGLPCFPTVQEIFTDRDLSVEDIVKIRSAHRDACKAMKSQLLGQGAASIDAVMRLVKYTKEEVSFQLEHRAYKLEADL